MKQAPAAANPEAAPATRRRVSGRSKVIVLFVVIAFLGLLIAKVATDGDAPADTSTAQPPGKGATITTEHNDAVADYEAALKTGKPVYVLFHSVS